jgi:hypothetical protein
MIHINLHLSAFPQAHRKRFLAQEVVIRFLEPAKERGTGPADSGHVLEILAAGYREARKGVLLEQNAPVHCHLDATIKKAIAVFQERRKLFTPPVAKFVAAAFKSCRAAAAQYRCEDCVGDTMCAGLALPGPHGAVVEPRYLRPLYVLSRQAAEFTQAIYDRYLHDDGKDIDIDLHFVSEKEDAARVTGVTMFDRPSSARLDLNAAARAAWIDLGLPLASLDAAKYFSIVYVIAHELAVHAVQELKRPGQPGRPRERVAFAEGLVDRVVYEELVEALRQPRRFPDGTLRNRALPHIESFHCTRKDAADEDTAYWSTDLILGRSAYEMLVRIGRYVTGRQAAGARARGESPRQWAHALALALALNLMAFSEEERQAIVLMIADLEDEFAAAEPGGLDWPDLEDWAKSPLGRMTECLVDIRETMSAAAGTRLVKFARGRGLQ